MCAAIGLGSTIVFSAALALGAGPAAPAVAEFKLTVAFYGLGKDPLSTTEIFFRQGRVFRLLSASSEVVVFDPRTGHLELLDLRRSIRTELPMKRLDEAQEKLHKAIDKAVKKHGKSDSRADRVAAEISRNLIEPHFKQTYDAASHHLRLTNPAVEVDAIGEPETDPARLKLLSETMIALIKLGSLRDPEAIPPHSRLEALKVQMTDHGLRPTQTTFLYRLAGPPKKYRWTYQFEPTLTSHEREVLTKLSAVLERTRFVRFEQYEREE